MWITIDQAALALGVSTWHAYRIARVDRWQRTPGRASPGNPRGYLLADIRRTAIARKARHD